MSRSRVIKELKVKTGDATHLIVKLNYDEGGMNYFQGCSMQRGLYLSVVPITRAERSTITKAFSGTSTPVLEMKRFNQKVLDNFVPNEITISALIANVKSKNGITLEEV
jgi:hypothetical protein